MRTQEPLIQITRLLLLVAFGFIGANSRPTVLARSDLSRSQAQTESPIAPSTADPAVVHVLTWHNDNARTGQNLQETILTPTNVNPTDFGKLFVLNVDGKVDAQPLYVSSLSIPGRGTHNVLFIATEQDSVYAFDADDGTPLWQVTTLPAGETTSDAMNCGQVVPQVGITATPVIDLTAGPNGTIYVVAMSKTSGGTYFHRLHALNLATGAEQFGGPKEIGAMYPGNGDNSVGGFVVFDPKRYKDRTGLALSNGVIYTTWAATCDVRPYTGWIIGYDRLTLAQVSVLNVTPNGNSGAMWNAGAAPAFDESGNLYTLTGNGSFDTTLDANGFPNMSNFGNCFIKVTTANNQLRVADYWTMFNTVQESKEDLDFASGGAVLLPDMMDAGGVVRHLAVGAGKDHHIYLADRDNMGKFNPQSNANLYQDLEVLSPMFSTCAYFNGYLYFGGIFDQIKAFRFTNARLDPNPTSRTAGTFIYPGTTPSISANGTANGILWAPENGDPAVLHAYDALDLAHEYYNSNMAANSRDHFGVGNKFIAPTIANGKVYIGTTTGVGVFGLLQPKLISALSRKTHGPAGTFDVDLPLTGNIGIEDRRGAGNGAHTIIARFANIITSANAFVSSGSGMVTGTSISGNTITADLAGVTNAQVLTLTFTNVTDVNGHVLPSASLNIGFLLGDTNASHAVNASDIGQTKAQSGRPVTPFNFREDVTVEGAIGASDIGLVKSVAGSSLP